MSFWTRIYPAFTKTDLDLHYMYLSFSMWIYINNLDLVIWLTENLNRVWHLNLFSRIRVNKSSGGSMYSVYIVSLQILSILVVQRLVRAMYQHLIILRKDRKWEENLEISLGEYLVSCIPVKIYYSMTKFMLE